jgi:hypothetical protein
MIISGLRKKILSVVSLLIIIILITRCRDNANGIDIASFTFSMNKYQKETLAKWVQRYSHGEELSDFSKSFGEVEGK